MFSLLAGILAFFYDLVPNYAVAIALLTLTVMLVLTPITLKGTRSMLAMQKLQPEMKRIQEMHKGDRQAQNEAMMAFYKEHKINPLAGCLPMLAQIPVMIVMFRVINGLVKTKVVDGIKVGNPDYISKSSELYKALHDSGGKMMSFGVDFAAHPANAGGGAVVLYILIGLVVATGYWQVRQMQSRNSNAAQINPQAQMMTKIMPLFSGLISLEPARRRDPVLPGLEPVPDRTADADVPLRSARWRPTRPRRGRFGVTRQTTRSEAQAVRWHAAAFAVRRSHGRRGPRQPRTATAAMPASRTARSLAHRSQPRAVV